MGAESARASTRGVPGRRAGEEVARHRGLEGRVPWGLVVAGVGVALWLTVDPRTPDLAGQVYRANLFSQAGFMVWDGHWYAGHDLPGYSLLFPPLAALLGVRTVGALAVLASVVLFGWAARAAFGPAARWGAVWFAVAALGDVWSGRIAFALGLSFGLGAVLALMRGRTLVVVGLAVGCAASSPVAGVLLGLAGFTHSLTVRSPRSVLVLGVPPAVVVLALAALFPEGGWEPYPLLSFLATMAVVTGFLWVVPPGRRLLRVGAVVYLVACVVSLAVHSPLGSNIERYGVLLAGPLLVCAVGTGVRRSGVAAVLCGIALWTVWGPVRETRAIAGNASTSPSYYVPVERFIAGHRGALVRVEVPFTRGHWEAAWLAARVSLARGWEKQLDERYDGALLSKGLTAQSYRRWLDEQAVSYVALPDTPLDPSSAREGRLIREGLPYLREVFESRHWRIYEVLDPTPLAQGPGTLSGMGHDWFALRVRAPGSFVVRVRYTRYWTVTQGAACVSRTPAGWTAVTARGAGTVTVAARFSLGRALGLDGGSCRPVPELAGPALTRVGLTGSPAYRWLIRTQGPPPSIARENRARGLTTWRLPGPPNLLGGEGRGPVEGYVARQAIGPGQTQRVYVDAPGSRTVTLQVFRMGWYGGRGGRLVLQSWPLRTVRQPPCRHRPWTGLTECRWHATLSFQIPRALSSGVYIVKLQARNGAQRDCLFVVRPARPAPLLVVIPTATYEAYNTWGGDSLYPGGEKLVGATRTDRGVEVSYDRPYASQTGAGQFFIREVAMVRFLERYGYPVSYTTTDSIDRDPGQLLGVRGVIDVGHSEYWSQRAENALLRARERGTSLIFVSSDTMAWRVRFASATATSSQAGEPDHVIVAYKESAALDPNRAEPTGLFPLGAANLVGSAYDGCITPRVDISGPAHPPVYRYYAWSPAPDLQPRWLFARTGIAPSTRIPGIVGYELDERTAASPPGTRLIGEGTGMSCGSEREPSPAYGEQAQTTLYEARSGALVFATGTLGWEYALSPVPQASPDAPRASDPRVVAMTRNLLARVLAR
jgi:hypothetical protein